MVAASAASAAPHDSIDLGANQLTLPGGGPAVPYSRQSSTQEVGGEIM